MLETLWALGRRLEWEGIPNPFVGIDRAIHYPDGEAARRAVREVGERIRSQGLPPILAPLVVGFAGYGNVSRGAQEIFDLLPFQERTPEDLPALFAEGPDNHILYKVVFREEHMVEPVSPEDRFDLQDYYRHPEKYRSRFAAWVPYLTLLVNGIYWEARYPRLVTKAYLRELFGAPAPPADHRRHQLRHRRRHRMYRPRHRPGQPHLRLPSPHRADD